MAVTDPIADFLTRIRNASKAKKLRVDIPASNMKKSLAEILKQQKFINDYSVIEDSKQNILRVELKYSNGLPAINGLKKISKPGLRVYNKSADLPRVLNGLGIAVVSTSKGLLTDKEAKTQSMGGEVICYIW
jgi:small subunit ribosomal protein S8|uniref:Small ribosomal subunit protein uS8 n=1 Tax=uncultured Ignavibacteria bacterium Rifle_16ft_4_minimus_20697 TaxID=1665100 RepID=A0A0H4T4I0_9BACT|nr:30S ribosomal protein S8, small subunit ribosomal protein S8 [uncultured Ignavibacteria bacterium Rifle_16ft_4_minimus_20697]